MDREQSPHPGRRLSPGGFDGRQDELAIDVAARELDESQMCSWAQALGARLRGGDVVLLRGEMGAGKTTLVRALARGLAVARPERVCSPTYTICMIHPGPIELVHLDLFRLGEHGPLGDAAFESLGLEHDELPGPDRVLVVEWSELWREPPAQHLELTLERVPGRAVRRLGVRLVGPRWIQDAPVWADPAVFGQ